MNQIWDTQLVTGTGQYTTGFRFGTRAGTETRLLGDRKVDGKREDKNLESEKEITWTSKWERQNQAKDLGIPITSRGANMFHDRG